MQLVEYAKNNHLVTIRMNRPEKRNALNIELIESLRGAWIRYAHDEDAWLAILTGEGRVFSAGADISLLETAENLQTGSFFRWFDDMVQRDLYWSGRLDKPTISAINGHAIGAGFHLAIMGDLRVAVESTQFHLPEAAKGVVLLLWDNLPYVIAAQMISGLKFTAKRAYEVGLINQVVSDGQLMDTAMGMAEELLSRPPLALQHSLRIVRAMNRASIPIHQKLINDYAALLSDKIALSGNQKDLNV